MKTETLTKWSITISTVLWWLLLPTIGYTNGLPYPQGVYSCGCAVADHLLYMFCHASVWHLCGNLFVVWMLRGKLYIAEAIMTAFVVSWLPVLPGLWPLVSGEDATVSATVGLSGVLFGIIGVKWGVYCGRRVRYYRVLLIKVLPCVLLGALVPNINWSLHLYCLTVGIGVGVTESLWNKRYRN